MTNLKLLNKIHKLICDLHVKKIMGFGEVVDLFGQFLIVASLSTSIFFVYIGYFLYRNHKQIYFQKRFLIFLISQYILTWLYIAIARPMVVAANFLNYKFVSLTAVHVFHDLTLFGVANIGIARIAYYFIQVHRVTQATISSSSESNFVNIVIRNTDSNLNKSVCCCCCCCGGGANWCLSKICLRFFGSPVRLFGLVCICWLIECTVSISMIDNLIINVQDGLGRYIAMTIALGVGLSYCVIICIAARNKVFQFDDHWYITQEYRKLGKIIGYHIVVNSCIIIVEILIPSKFHNIQTLVRLCHTPVLISLAIGYCYITFIWVWKINEKHNTSGGGNYATPQLMLTLNSVTNSRSDSFVDNNNNNDHDAKGSRIVNVNKKIELTSHASDLTSTQKHNENYSKISKMNHFWDKSYDAQSNHVNIKTQFIQFSNHCVSELTIENLLFFVNCVQLLEFLIEKKYFDLNNATHLQIISPMNTKWCVSHFMKDTNAINGLKMAYDLFHETDQHDDDDYINNGNKQVDYSIFVSYYINIYERFLQRDYAPFEINISHKPRQRFYKYYQDITLSDSDEAIMTQEYFHLIWKDLKDASLHVYGLLSHAFYRFKSKSTLTG